MTDDTDFEAKSRALAMSLTAMGEAHPDLTMMLVTWEKVGSHCTLIVNNKEISPGEVTAHLRLAIDVIENEMTVTLQSETIQ